MRIWWAVMLQHLIFLLEATPKPTLIRESASEVLEFSPLLWSSEGAIPLEESPLEMAVSIHWDFFARLPTFRWNQAKSGDLHQAQCPVVMLVGACGKRLSKLGLLRFTWEMKEAQRDLLSTMGSPRLVEQLLCVVVSQVYVLHASPDRI